jgi:hypothetical protein
VSPGRKLRAVRRVATVERLFADGEVPFDGAPMLKVRDGVDDRPLVLIRAGARDVKAVHRAIATGARPSGVTVGLGELKTTVRAVRQVSTALGVPWGSDPLLYKTTFPGYRTAVSLQALDYTPGRDAEPYSVEELSDAELLRQIVRKTVGHQFDMGAGFIFGADFYIRGIDDPMLAVSLRALALSIDARDAFGPRPLIAPVRVDLSNFRRPRDQALLVRELAARRPDAFLLHLSGLHEDATAGMIVDAVRLMLALQTVGGAVILARPGDLRHIAMAAGARGVEIGLGRLLRFSAPDYLRGASGPGPIPVRFEFPSLVASLSGAATEIALEGGRLPECGCSCPTCSKHASIVDRVRHAPEHNMHMSVGSAKDATGLSPAERCQELDQRLARASWLWNGVKHPAAAKAQQRGQKWRTALHDLDEQGLLVPDAAAEALGLTG